MSRYNGLDLRQEPAHVVCGPMAFDRTIGQVMIDRRGPDHPADDIAPSGRTASPARLDVARTAYLANRRGASTAGVGGPHGTGSNLYA